MLQQLSAFSVQGFAHCLNIYNFPEDYRNRPDIVCNGLRSLYQWNNKYKYNKYNITEEGLRQKSIDAYQRALQKGDMQTVAEVADMLLQFDPERGREFLDNLRNFELEQEEKKLIAEGKHREAKLLHVSGNSVYSDSQNVHNSNINKSVLKAAKKFWSMYEKKILGDNYVYPEGDAAAIQLLDEQKSAIVDIIEQKLVEIRPFDYEFIHDKCKYIKANTATFGIEVSIKDIFMALNTWISEQKEQEELYNRVFEELKEMNGLCSSGHLSRFINVLQGYVDDPELIVNISEEDQYTAIIRHYLNKALQECENEDVIDGIISGSETYKIFIREKIKEKLLDWEDDYGEDFIKYVPKIVNKFANTEIFKEK